MPEGAEPVATVAVPGGSVEILSSDALDLGEAKRKTEARRGKLQTEIDRAERKLSNEGFTAKGAGRGGRGRAREAVAPAGRTGGSGMSATRGRGQGPWSRTEAERYLLSLELFGMRFGLDRMRRLMTALGHPERQFDSIHVVGTNGKSSTTRMIAAILAHHGLRTGSYLSPHLVSFAERIRIDDSDLEPAAFAGAVQRAAHAAELVDHSLEGDDRVTQFEALTAAAYFELARRGVEVAVIEAGLGGRYDATNVIPSKVQVLTSVGLEHTRWLGPTIHDIASEKLDVVQPGATLVLGAGLHPEAEARAEALATERGARIVRAGIDPGVPVAALGAFQRRNFALARVAAEAYLGELDPRALADAAAEIKVPGRLQIVGQEPADAARRRSQPRRDGSPRGVAQRAVRRRP